MKGKIWLCVLLFAALASVPFLVPHCGWVALFAFIPLLKFADLCETGEVKHKDWLLYLAFILFNLATTFWINWISVPGAITAITLNSLQMWVIFRAFIYSKKHFKGGMSYLFLITMWIAWERVYQNVEISWPWLILGNSLATSPLLAQWYEYTGFLGGSLWIWLSNIFIYETVKALRIKSKTKYDTHGKVALAVITAILLIAPPAVSICIYNNYHETDNPLEVVAVQPNIDAYTEKHGGLRQEVQDEKMLNLVRGVITDSTVFVITPETYTFQYDLDKPETNVTYAAIQRLLRYYPQTSFILGAITYRLFPTRAAAPYNAHPVGDKWYCSYNTAMMIDTTGMRNYYHKSKLVPAVEIIPYQRYLGFLGKIFELFGGSMSSYGVSDDVHNLTSKEGTDVGVMICYESIYGEYYRRTANYGAQFTAVITNDGWWGDTPGYRQHFRFAKLRAIETRRDVVHVANTGISGFINQRGDVIQRTGWWEPVAIRNTVNLNNKKTCYTEYGDVTGRLCSFMFLLLLIALLARRLTSK
ncbi:MAG: apolipoprotein N-acyltransferase [Bacteroidales bacterium]|nr:apolipoprotein N-acyltransferase [Bacteroidales bacterium]